MGYDLNRYPTPEELETVKVLKMTTLASRKLAELKGLSQKIPNQAILINTLFIQEAKDSSAIENIITTHDDLFKEELFPELDLSPSAKEVQSYVSALRQGYELIAGAGFLSVNHILAVQEILEKNKAGFRKLPGTDLRNGRTGEVVYTPPQGHDVIIGLMGQLEAFINQTGGSLDPLVKMAVIHHQFESIHPFYDGNGRTGRILNVLYLVKEGLLEIPILYLSRYIVQNKGDYYERLQSVRDTGDWEPWILYMLEAVAQTAEKTVELVKAIDRAWSYYKANIKAKLASIYSQDLLNNLFFHPYTKIEFLMKDLNLKSRITATKYLDTLSEDGFLHKAKIGRSNYYINVALMEILTTGDWQAPETKAGEKI